MYCQCLINEMDQTVNPAGVEASMRLQYGTLGHLDKAVFAEEIESAKESERFEPGFLKSIADSFGLRADFAKWEDKKADGLYGPKKLWHPEPAYLVSPLIGNSVA